jgi:hypothetical protein
LGTVSTKYFNVKNGLTTGDLLVSQSNVTLGNVSNLHISGGSSGYLLRTDGAANLSWVDPASTENPAPMPIVVANGTTLTISNNFQGLFGTTLTIDGTLVIDGIMVDVSGQGPPGSNSQVSFNDGGSPGAADGFTFNKVTGNLNVPGSFNAGAFIKCVAYSSAELRAVTGVIGQLAVVNDSNPVGMPAYWDGTNNRWSYIFNNNAV